MSWFDGFGLLFVAALLVPNIQFAATRPDGFENRYHNPTRGTPGAGGAVWLFYSDGVAHPGALPRVLVRWRRDRPAGSSVVLVTLYLLGWLVFWKEDSVRKSLALAILPSLLFLERGF